MDVKISENLLYEMVELLVEAKSLRPSENECVLHLSKRNRILDQLLVMRRNALNHRDGHKPLYGILSSKVPAESVEAA